MPVARRVPQIVADLPSLPEPIGRARVARGRPTAAGRESQPLKMHDSSRRTRMRGMKSLL